MILKMTPSIVKRVLLIDQSSELGQKFIVSDGTRWQKALIDLFQKNKRTRTESLLAAAALSDLGMVKEAGIEFKRCLAEEPGYAAAHLLYAMHTLQFSESNATSISHFEEALRLEQGNAAYPYLYGMSLWTARLDFPKVEQLYLRALELDGNCAPAHNELGLLLWDGLGRPEEAERHFQSAIEAAPDDPRGHGMYAVYLMEFKQDKEGAERHFKAALELDPTDAQNHLDHGRLLFDLYFEDDAALAEMQKAIELQPRYADAYLWLAKVELIAFHDPESARSALLEGFRIIRGPGVRQSTLEKMATEQMHVWIKSELKRCGDLPDEAVELRKMDLEVWGDRRHR